VTALPPPDQTGAPAPADRPEAPAPPTPPAGEGTTLPGVHRGGFQRLPTAPVGIPAATTAPGEPGYDDVDTGQLLPVWMPPPQPAVQRRGVAAWALFFSIAGLAMSLFVGWAFPVGLVGAVTAIVALRRPFESRMVAVWALVLGVVSVLYSAGWLVWAASRGGLFG
jgi:hypothetical protein